MAGGGTAQTVDEATDRFAADRAALGDITEPMAEVLTAVHGWRVAKVGDQWAIDVSRLARVALRAGLVARVGEDGRTLLKLTAAGRAAVTRIHADRRLAASRLLTLAYRRGVEITKEATAPLPVRRWRSAAAVLTFGLGMFAAGLVVAVLATWPAGR